MKPWEKLSIFILMVLISYFFGAIFSGVLTSVLGGDLDMLSSQDYGSMEVLRLKKILLFVSHIFIFIIPALVFSKLASFHPLEFLNLNPPTKKWFLVVPLLFIGLTIFNELLYLLNRSIDFSFISSAFQAKLELQQAWSDKMIHAFVGTTWKSYFFNLILIAIVPAIGEELTFRGVIQRLTINGTQNVHIGIVMCAALFALIHFQPFNILPIFVLGVCYGYISIALGSLWFTIVLHFLNNALQISLLHLARYYRWDMGSDSSGMLFQIPILLVTIGTLYYLYRKNESGLGGGEDISNEV